MNQFTLNDAYDYARRWRKRYPEWKYADLEAQMVKDKLSDEDVALVKRWLNTWAGGKRGWSK